MNKYLIITIDVEPDCSPNWRYSDPITFNGVHLGIKELLQPLFNKHGFTPTYLINNVVLEDDASVNTFKSLQGSFELGTHLHPEFIEPLKTELNYAGKKGIANSCFYAPVIEFEKIKNITHLFHEKFDYMPTSFRAGRFSAGANTIKSLKKLNYKVDSSVTPNVRWDDHTREKPVDFRSAPQQPYWPDTDNITKSGKSGTLLEVPVSIIRKKLSGIHYLKSVFKNKRLPYKGSEAVWLRPKFSGISGFTSIVEEMTSYFINNNDVVFNMMFHNVEVMPGLSPYSLTAKDCKDYMYSLEWFLTYCNSNNIKGLALSSLYDIFSKQ